MLKRINKKELFHYNNKGEKVLGPHSNLSGDCSNLSGDCSYLSGDCSYLSGDCSYLSGDCSGLSGNLDDCKRDTSVLTNIEDLVEEVS